MRTRKAQLPDARRIHELMAAYVTEEILLPRSLGEISENIRDFTVVEHRGQIVGCGALHFYGTDLAEVRSIAVDAARQRRGAGRRLVEALLAEARQHRVERVCLFTRIPDYFARLGFAPAAHESLPQKIWKDCLKCPRFYRCDETPMVYAGFPARAEAGRAALPILDSLPGSP